MKFLILILLLSLNAISYTQASQKIDSTVFTYDEKEQGTEVVRVRYILSKNYMRIDEGKETDDFVLYDIHKNILYSVNHDDMTILFIEYNKWQVPANLGRKVIEKVLHEAPKISGKTIAQYHLLAKDKICAEVQYIPDVFKAERLILQAYQNLISSQLVMSLDNTPKDMQTDCMLVDHVYNKGDLYNKGLPIQEQHENGFMKVLVDYKQQRMTANLFELPEKYEKYQPFKLPTQNQ